VLAAEYTGRFLQANPGHMPRFSASPARSIWCAGIIHMLVPPSTWPTWLKFPWARSWHACVSPQGCDVSQTRCRTTQERYGIKVVVITGASSGIGAPRDQAVRLWTPVALAARRKKNWTRSPPIFCRADDGGDRCNQRRTCNACAIDSGAVCGNRRVGKQCRQGSGQMSARAYRPEFDESSTSTCAPCSMECSDRPYFQQRHRASGECLLLPTEVASESRWPIMAAHLQKGGSPPRITPGGARNVDRTLAGHHGRWMANGSAAHRREGKARRALRRDLRIIDFTLSNCINSDVRQILVLTQYKSILSAGTCLRASTFCRAPRRVY